MDINILYEDKFLCLCIKPAGILSESGGMPEALSDVLGGSFYCVHRLDRAVGGVMVYARDERTAAALSQMTAQHRLEKDYLALIPDVLDEKSGTMRDLLFRDKGKNKSYVVKRMRRGVKEASLEYSTLAAGDGLALLKIRLHTGRSHQIRCQLSSRKAPIVGDGRYGSQIKNDKIALWSYSLGFRHPVTGRDMSFSALPTGTVWEKYLCDAQL